MLRSIKRACDFNNRFPYLLPWHEHCRDIHGWRTETKSNSDIVIPVGSATLVDMAKSHWGPLTKLTRPPIRDYAKANMKVAVARKPFNRHNDRQLRLNQVVQKIGSSIVAVRSSLLNHNRWVVDVYNEPKIDEYGHGMLKLKLDASSQDLVKFISQQGATPVLVPDSEFPITDKVFNRNGVRAAVLGLRQSTNSVLMVSPTAFGFNEQAAEDNKFMDGSLDHGDVGSRALKEFEGLHRALTEKAGIQVHLFEHSQDHGTPDAVFPNNWFTTHQAGEPLGALKPSVVVYYPLKCPNRRKERRDDVKNYLGYHINYDDIVDFAMHENGGTYFEGTGVMVLDRVNGVVYLAASERADLRLAEQWADRMGYKEVVFFTATDGQGNRIYHTNVMMAIGTDFAVVCAESVADESERKNLLAKLSRCHEVIEISRSQVNAFCGNILELVDGRGVPIVAMSTRALKAFTDDQKKCMLRNVAGFVDVPFDTIETVGGGGVRCTLAELF